MRKLTFVIVILGLSFVSCESTDNLNDETGIEIEEVFSTDPDEDLEPGGSGGDGTADNEDL